jgi:hypothetical protein
MRAPRSPFVYLLSDPWIAVSWLFLIGPGLLAVLLLLQSSSPMVVHSQGEPPVARADVPTGKVIAFSLGIGYSLWSSYFGLAACWRFVIGKLSDIVWLWVAGCFSLVTFGWVLLIFGFLYAIFGGGIYQFLRRWWLLAHGTRPPFLTAPRGLGGGTIPWFWTQ